MQQLSSLLTSLATATGTVGARPGLVTDGVDISSWKSGSFMPREAAVLFDGAALSTIAPTDATLIPSGAELWGLVVLSPTVPGKWKFVGPLQMYGGNIVLVDATHGFTTQINDPSPFTRLAIAGTVTGGAASYAFVPLETWR